MSPSGEPKDDTDLFRQAITPVYELIGAITSNWSHYERFIDETIWAVAGLKAELGMCLTANIQAARYKLFTLSALFMQRNAEDLAKKLNPIAEETDRLARLRNRVVHDPISVRSTDWVPLRKAVTAERVLVYRSEPLNLDQYVEHSQKVFDLAQKFLKFQAEVYLKFPNKSGIDTTLPK